MRNKSNFLSLRLCSRVHDFQQSSKAPEENSESVTYLASDGLKN